MRLESIVTTPNPNSMKLNFAAPISTAKATTYENKDLATNIASKTAPDSKEATPDYVAQLLSIEGVNSVFVCGDFLTINRDPRHDWKPILDAASKVFRGSSESEDTSAVERQRQDAEKSGQVSVVVQTFKGVPIQVKALAPETEKRIALSNRFSEAAQAIQSKLGSDFLKERYWADWGVRYGDPAEIAAEVAEEIEGTIDEEALTRLVAHACGERTAEVPKLTANEIEKALSSQDWQSRLKAVQELGSSPEDIPLLTKALSDDRMQVRRFAAAALGATGDSDAIAPLSKALLEDTAVAVRRTAGDALSDIGDPAAEDAMCKALTDENKLVRWRAARYLAEVGSQRSLGALETAMKDVEFEVRLEAQAASERILQGSTGLAPAWKRILEETI